MPDALAIAPVTMAPPTSQAREATLQAASLRAALGFVRRAVDRRSIPAAAMVLVRAVPYDGLHPDHLELTATNLDMQARRTVPAMVTAPFSGMIDPATLNNLLRNLPRLADVTLCPDGSDKWAISCPSANMAAKNLTRLHADDFPLLVPEAGSDRNATLLDAPDFAGALARCLSCTSREELIRYYLNGVYLHPSRSDAGRIVAVATDGQRMMVTGCAGPLLRLDRAPNGIIVPNGAVSLICLMLAGRQMAKACLVTFPRSSVPGLMIRTDDGVEIITRTIDGTFPDYERIVPQTVSQVLQLSAPDLARAVRLAMAPITSKTGPGVRLQGHAAGGIAVSTSADAADGTITVTVPAQTPEQAAPLPPTRINGHYLLDMIDALGGDTILWRYTGRDVPQIFSRPDSTDIFVQMPMRF